MLMIRGAVKDYDWGIIDGLVPWTGEQTQAPQAELWFGVHSSGPSPLISAGDDPSNAVLSGEVLSDHADVDHVPILVKILAARRPLSVQVHPTQDMALWGWAMQKAGTITEMFSDPNEKTEMLVAIEPFETFAGWRDCAQAQRVLQHLAHTDAAAVALASGDRESAITALLAIPESVRDSVIAALPDAARAAGLSDAEVSAYATVAREYPSDPGAPLTVLLAYQRLEPGEALFVQAGIPHSYIRGRGVEVMTSSDNVLRLGLTPKPVFVDMAMRALDFTSEPVLIKAGVGQTIEPAGAPFGVTLVESGEYQLPRGRYRLVLALAGEVRVGGVGGENCVLAPGTAAVFLDHEDEVQVHADGLAALVSAPIVHHDHDHDHDHIHDHIHNHIHGHIDNHPH